MYDDDEFIKSTLLLALAYFGGHVLYYIGVRIILLLIGKLPMRKFYKVLDDDGSVVRIFGYKEEAERFRRLDKSLKEFK